MRLTPAACAPVVLALLVPSSGAAYERATVADKPGVFLFWTNRVIDYTINSNGSKDLPLSEVTGAIKRAFFSWASPSCTDISFRFSGYDTATRTNLVLGENEQPDHKNLIVWHEDRWPPAGTNDPSLNDKVPAITTAIYDANTGAITDADIDLNGFNFFWTTTDDTTKAAWDVQNIISHEVGHLIGLAHSQNQEATMWSTTKQGELTKRVLKDDDIAGVCFIYPFQGTTPAGPGQGTIKNDVQGGCELTPASYRQEAASSLCSLLLLAPALLWLCRPRRRS